MAVRATMSSEERTLAGQDNFWKRLQVFLKANMHNDLTILCGGLEWKAHSVIVFSHSPVLESIYDTDGNNIVLPEDYTDIVGNLLDTMYNFDDLKSRTCLNGYKKSELGELMFLARQYAAGIIYEVEVVQWSTVERAKQILCCNSDLTMRGENDYQKFVDAARLTWSTGSREDRSLREVFLDYLKRPQSGDLMRSSSFLELVKECGEFAADVFAACGVQNDVIGKDMCITCRKLYMKESKRECCNGVTFKIRELA